jgi:hypothetical protein
MSFKKATRDNIWAKILLISPSGGGKSYSALTLAEGIAEAIKNDKGEDARVAMIGTESSRDRYYAKEFDYDLMQLKPPFTPESYVKGIDEAIEEGYKVLVIDSMTHEWSGQGGALDIHSKIPGNSYTAWNKVTPRHNKFIDKIIESEIFVIATVRGKDEYVLEEVNGKQVPRKVALGYEQRKDTEYLFTCAFNIDQDTHLASAVKDNTHIFENKNDILTKKDGHKVYEWATGGDLDEKLEEVKKSIEEGKTKQALNEEKEAKELAKNKKKSVPEKPKKKPEPKTDNKDKKKVIQDIRNEFGKLVKKGRSQGDVLDIMAKNGTNAPSEETDIKTLEKILQALKDVK